MFNKSKIKKMITLTQKQFEKAVKKLMTAARLDEISRLEGYVPSALISKRKGILKKQLASFAGQKKEEETSINIRIEIPEEGNRIVKKEKSFAANLKNLISGNSYNINEDDDDENVFSVIKSLMPKTSRQPLGKIVREL